MKNVIEVSRKSVLGVFVCMCFVLCVAEQVFLSSMFHDIVSWRFWAMALSKTAGGGLLAGLWTARRDDHSILSVLGLGLMGCLGMGLLFAPSILSGQWSWTGMASHLVWQTAILGLGVLASFKVAALGKGASALTLGAMCGGFFVLWLTVLHSVWDDKLFLALRSMGVM